MPVIFTPMFFSVWLYWIPCILLHGHTWMGDVYIFLTSLVPYFIACLCARLILYHVFFISFLLCFYLCVCVCVCLLLLLFSFIIVLELLPFNIHIVFRAIHASAHYFQYVLTFILQDGKCRLASFNLIRDTFDMFIRHYVFYHCNSL